MVRERMRRSCTRGRLRAGESEGLQMNREMQGG